MPLTDHRESLMRSNRSANSLASPGRWRTAWTPGRATTISAACQGTLSATALSLTTWSIPEMPGTFTHLHPVERRNRDCPRLAPLKTQDRTRLESQRTLGLASTRQELQAGSQCRAADDPSSRDCPPRSRNTTPVWFSPGARANPRSAPRKATRTRKPTATPARLSMCVFMTLILRTDFPWRQA